MKLNRLTATLLFALLVLIAPLRAQVPDFEMMTLDGISATAPTGTLLEIRNVVIESIVLDSKAGELNIDARQACSDFFGDFSAWLYDPAEAADIWVNAVPEQVTLRSAQRNAFNQGFLWLQSETRPANLEAMVDRMVLALYYGTWTNISQSTPADLGGDVPPALAQAVLKHLGNFAKARAETAALAMESFATVTVRADFTTITP